MKQYPSLFVAIVGLWTASVLSAQPAQPAKNVGPKLVQPHSDAVTPEFLAEHNQNGFAVVEALIDADGKFVNGYPILVSHPDLIRYAVDSAKNWKYRPAEREGEPVQELLDIPVFYRGDMNVTDEQLAPLVQLGGYIYHLWLRTHGYTTYDQLLEVRKKPVSGVTLLRRIQTDFLYADQASTPPDMQAAVPFVNKVIGKSVFPDTTVSVVQRMGQITILLPVLDQKKAPAL
ncbi:MAG TPA: energy transducer TonB [Opitutaceae bacterium]|jgi:hypothetical protein